MSELPAQRQKYINDDGTLTTVGYALFDDMVRRISELESAGAAQDLILTDHEARIVVLEP